MKRRAKRFPSKEARELVAQLVAEACIHGEYNNQVALERARTALLRFILALETGEA